MSDGPEGSRFKTRVLFSVVSGAFLNRRGQCACGWSGKRRLFHGSAVVDVGLHCAQTGHTPVRIAGWTR